MRNVICCAGTVVLLLAVFSSYPDFASAQIAPTNSATISGSLSDSAGKPVPNAKISLSGPKSASTQTDAQGLFVFIGVPFGTYTISAAAAGLGTATRGVSVEGDVNVAIQYEPASMNGLKVIANVSSSANAHFNVTPASITQVNPIANAFEGKTSWRTILEQIPGVAQAGLGNGFLLGAAYPDGPLVPVQISIDGALPYETATLLDDMPLIGTSYSTAPGLGTNLASYPLNGFDSADVVRGPGANAPSIVDSIGGSFVLHSPGAVEHNQYNFSLSTDPYGGIVANAQAAVRWKKLSAVVTYGVNDSPGPISTAGVTPDGQYGLGGIATVDGNPFYAYSPPCNPPGCEYGSALIDPRYSATSFPVYGYQEGALVCCVNYSSAWTQHSGSVALRYALSPNVNAEVFYAGQNSLTPVPQPYAEFDFLSPAGYTGPTGASLLSVSSSVGSTYQNVSSLLEEKITAQLGHGVVQLAALQNRSFSTFGANFPTAGTVQLYGAGCVGTVYPSTTPTDCPAGGTLTLYNGGTHSVTLPTADEYYTDWANNRDLLFSYVTPLGENFHAGASFVKSYYDSPSTSFCNFPIYGIDDLTFSTPSAISQTTNEMRVFVGGNLSEKTSLDLSMYFANANYHVRNPNDLTGNTYADSNYNYAAPRLGFVWRPTAAVAVRASAGGGFAEAPLFYLIGSNAPNCSSGTSCTVTIPNLNLQPEKSFAFDVGTDIKLPRNTVLSFDVYRSNLYGQLYNETSVTGTYLGLPLYTTQYGNLGESRYEGVLVDLRHTVPHGIYWSLSGGLTRGYVVSVPAGFYNGLNPNTLLPCTNCANLNVVPGVNFNGSFTVGASIPYAQGLGTLGYRWNTDKYVDLVGTYFGNNNTYFRPAFVEFDGHVGYPLTRNLSLLVTFRNITGIYDSPYQIYPGSLSGAPTISGLPYALFGEMYGPRTVLITSNLRF